MSKSRKKRIVSKETLDHIGAEQIKVIATASNCNIEYVRMIIKGERPTNSARARAIYRAAKELNRKIDQAQNTVKKELIIVGEND